MTEEIKHFFRVYKQLEGKKTIVDSVLDDVEPAKLIIEASIKRYDEKFKKQ